MKERSWNRLAVPSAQMGLAALLSLGAVWVWSFAALPEARGEVLVPAGADWKYVDTGEDFGSWWRSPDLDDEDWSSGPAPLGFGEDTIATTLSYGPDPDNKFTTYYFRHTFMVDDPEAYSQLLLRVLRDDGVVVYLNDTEVYRNNMPAGELDSQTLAVTNVYGVAEQTYFPQWISGPLYSGANVLAVELHQAGRDSVDVDFDLELSAGSTVQITRGPYLQMRSATNVLVRWRTDQPTDSVIRCGTDLDNQALTFSDATPVTEHQLWLTGCQPETKYYYTVGGQGVTTAGATDTFFVTAPPIGASRPTRVWFVSDYGFQDDGEMSVRDSYFNYIAPVKPADVWLTGGDNDQNNGSDENDQISIFDIYKALLRNTPIWPALGNHDSYTSSVPGPYPFYDNFSLPANGECGGLPSGSEHYFSFDYGAIHFITMDSIDPSFSVSPDTAMIQWLRADLASTTQRWRIVYWHGPPYTKGSHDSDLTWDISSYMIQMRENVLPVLESYGVDLVLNGHSHVYERSYLLHGHYGYSGTFSETNKIDGGDGRETGDGAYHQRHGQGTVYVVAALGGRPATYPYSFYEGVHPAHRVSIPNLASPAPFNTPHFGSLVLDVNGDRLDFQFVDRDGAVLDYFTLQKEVSFRVTRVSRDADTLTLRWTSSPAECYRVEWRGTLSLPWQPVADQIPSQGPVTEWTGRVEPAAASGFYRVAVSTCTD